MRTVWTVFLGVCSVGPLFWLFMHFVGAHQSYNGLIISFSLSDFFAVPDSIRWMFIVLFTTFGLAFFCWAYYIYHLLASGVVKKEYRIYWLVALIVFILLRDKSFTAWVLPLYWYFNILSDENKEKPLEEQMVAGDIADE